MGTTGTPHPQYVEQYTTTFPIMGSTPSELKAAAEDDYLPQETIGTPLNDITPHDVLLTTQAHALTKLTYMHPQTLVQNAIIIRAHAEMVMPTLKLLAHSIYKQTYKHTQTHMHTHIHIQTKEQTQTR